MTTEFQCCGCMLAAGNTYANTCAPEDVWKSMEKDRENTVDFISFSYYSSRLTSADLEAGEKIRKCICYFKESLFEGNRMGMAD